MFILVAIDHQLPAASPSPFPPVSPSHLHSPPLHLHHLLILLHHPPPLLLHLLCVLLQDPLHLNAPCSLSLLLIMQELLTQKYYLLITVSCLLSVYKVHTLMFELICFSVQHIMSKFPLQEKQKPLS